MRRIDLNVDIAEGFPHDAALLQFASSANVCAGEHAGSWELTKETIRLCQERAVRVGVHPGYPDRGTMGRKPIEPPDIERYRASILHQVERFQAIEPAAYFKPHGAFYNDAASQNGEAVREVVEEVCRVHRLPLMALPGTLLAEVAARAGVDLIREGFADRAYLPDGLLVPRSEPHAVLEDPAAVRAQVLRLASQVDSICLHGDTPGCLEFAGTVVAVLSEAGYEVGV